MKALGFTMIYGVLCGECLVNVGGVLGWENCPYLQMETLENRETVVSCSGVKLTKDCSKQFSLLKV